ncbi:MAG: hypothetical protein F9K44_14775 [Hyphomicrobiaceae bacterium]|nr:MAG: hypothetical protein F9K44_14775 [Hyphomicrobiaceae bacterium]
MTFRFAAVAVLALGASTASLFAQTTPAPTAPTPPPTATQPQTTPPKAPSQTASPTTPTSPSPDFRAACGEDVGKLCGSAKRGEVRRCIQANADKLSPACKTFIAASREERQKQFRAACAADVKTHCSKETRGDSKVRECLATNQAKLSDACKGFLATPRNAGLGKDKKAQ